MHDDSWLRELASNELDVVRAARAGEPYGKMTLEQTKAMAEKLEQDTRRRIAGGKEV